MVSVALLTMNLTVGADTFALTKPFFKILYYLDTDVTEIQWVVC